jgi:hypothetical protein
MSNLDREVCIDAEYARQSFKRFGEYIVMHSESKRIQGNQDFSTVHFYGTIRFRFPNDHGAAFFYRKHEEWDIEKDIPSSCSALQYSLHSLTFQADELHYDKIVEFPEDNRDVYDSKDNFAKVLQLLDEIRGNPCWKCGAYWFVMILAYAKDARTVV